jgi:DNA-binding MarR family transcriptional regulator/GNAT superfamily N-acetyltransferase
VGALNDHYLGRDRPLGEARLLWEIGEHGTDVRSVRSRLDLDSGYLSRLLRSLEAADLITIERSASDKRVRTIRPTRSGLAERAALDRRSNELAQSFLEPLTDAQRSRLLDAMADVERLLTLALVDINVVDPDDRHARHCLQEYFAELDRRFPTGFDPALSIPAGPERLRPPIGLFLVATLHSEPVGCGALKFHDDDQPTEVKRMWVADGVRGLGIGRRLLAALEAHAAARGSRALRLETSNPLAEAIAMYRSAGYYEVDAFNDEPYADHWFEKRLS